MRKGEACHISADTTKWVEQLERTPRLILHNPIFKATNQSIDLGKKNQTLENNCKKTEAGGIEKRSAIQSTEGPQISLGDRHSIGNARVFEVLVPVEREDDKLEQGQRSRFGFVWRCNRSSDFAP